MLTQTLKSKVSTLWDKFWSGGISNPLNAIEQITYLLFMKQLDENDILRKHNSSLKGEKYKSVSPTKDSKGFFRKIKGTKVYYTV